MRKYLPAKAQILFDRSLGDQGLSNADLRRHVSQRATDLTIGNDPVQAIPEDLEAYIDKVVLHAYKTTDSDVERLRDRGYDEDEIFELTVCASVAASLARFEKALEVMD